MLGRKQRFPSGSRPQTFSCRVVWTMGLVGWKAKKMAIAVMAPKGRLM